MTANNLLNGSVYKYLGEGNKLYMKIDGYEIPLHNYEPKVIDPLDVSEVKILTNGEIAKIFKKSNYVFGEWLRNSAEIIARRKIKEKKI